MDICWETVEVMAQRADKDERRLRALERSLLMGVTPTTASATPAAKSFDANTAVTIVDIGGNPVTISLNHMFQKTRARVELEAKVEVLMERAKNVGILFGRWGFPLEADFTLFIACRNQGEYWSSSIRGHRFHM